MAEEEDFREQFLKANANVDFMAHQLADCLRHCMRGVAAQQLGSQTYRAVESFKFLMDLMVRSKGVGFYQLFEKAIEELRPEDRCDFTEWAGHDFFERSITSAAEKGLQLLVEASCTDNAAQGRVSRRKTEFLDAIKRIEEARQEMIREYEKRR